MINFYSNYFTGTLGVLNETGLVETIFSPIVLVPQLLFISYFSIIFIIFYFNYFSSYTKEENTIDSDYLISSTTVEAEKEITCLDDMVLCLVIIIYIFGWYFFIHCWSLLSSLPEVVLLFYLLPALYFIIFGIPTLLAFNFGIYFLIYLKGVGSGPIFTVEFVFDIIAVIIFYTRIIVQGVRLILMLFTYASLNEYVTFYNAPSKAFLFPELF
jgi:hypothetical protein